ncbi:hypothetical protein KUF71_007908 [Frankliniella fusca]|uniref:Uncharacterized protein n=1 Tax=Frankliniella fusca TaxID=407009 RepID=A0AAE1HDI6_9NEOP|nr:hypothetical protein KUF71_007908 [Frankliniella fusca]
MNYLIFGFH